MLPYRVDFGNIEWESPLPGLRQKVLQDESRKIRLVEYAASMEPHWCEKGHYGFVLDGRFEIEFEGGSLVFSAGDGVFIPDGPQHRHKGTVLSETVTVIFVEEN